MKILDAMRFSLEIIDDNHNSLIEELTAVSIKGKKKNLPRIMHHTWSLIDFTQRFYSLYTKLTVKIDNDIEVLNNWAFRNACQHFTSNLEKVINNEKQPFGALKWAVNDIDKQDVFSCLAVSGIYGVFHGMSHTFINVTGKQYDSIINEITLEIAVFDKKEQRTELNLSELMIDLGNVVKKLESNLVKHSSINNLTQTDWSKYRDVLLIIRQEK